MSLRFYIGNSRSPKSTRMLSDIIQRSINEPERNFFVIVPEQFTMQTQREMTSLHPRHGLINIDILSFERLAYRVFEETGIVKHALLEESGKRLILKKIALSEKDNLPYLGSRLSGSAGVDDIKSMISELMQYNVTPNDLDNICKSHISTDAKGAASSDTYGNSESTDVTHVSGDSKNSGKSNPDNMKSMGIPYAPVTAKKLADIAYIYRKYKEYLEGSYMAVEEVPLILSRVVEKAESLKNSVIAFDGFTGFTPVQLPVMEKLLVCADEVDVSVTCDPSIKNFYSYKTNDLFAMSCEMMTKLAHLADDTHTEILPHVLVSDADHGTFASPIDHRESSYAAAQTQTAATNPLAHLERSIFRTRRLRYDGEPENIKIFSSSNPTSEVYLAARNINRLVRTEGMRYRDFAVITGDIEKYGDLTRRIFPEEGIPAFVDTKISVLYNPLVEFVRAVLAVPDENWSYASVFRLLRTGFFDISEDDIDRLDNYALALGIRGRKKWTNDFIYAYRGQDPEEVPHLNEIRTYVIETLSEFTAVFGTRMSTVKEKTAALYHLISSLDIQQKLMNASERFKEDGKMALSSEYAQIYKVVMDLFDKTVEVLGDEKISVNDYAAVLDASLADIKMGLIPLGNDLVTVGDMQRSRLSHVKVLIFLGVNDGLIPKSPGHPGLLSEAERHHLYEDGIRLSPDARTDLFMQRFYLYLNLTAPSKYLILSFARTDEKGAAINPAYLISTMTGLFPALSVNADTGTSIDDLEHPSDGLRLLPQMLRDANGIYGKEKTLELYRYYAASRHYSSRIKMIQTAASKRQRHDTIGNAVARALYGENLRNSPTRLEEFAACQFRHFLNHGLRLSERIEFEFDSLDRGNVLHGALERYAKELIHRNVRWQDISEAERISLCDRFIDMEASDYGNNKLHDTSRSVYEIERLKRLMRRTVWALTKQLAGGDFQPYAFELKVNIPVSPNMTLTGKIDRVDICKDNGRTLVKIIDYKTGSTKFDLTMLYNGLQLQLPLYMRAALDIIKKSTGARSDPAAMFYYAVNDPICAFDSEDVSLLIGSGTNSIWAGKDDNQNLASQAIYGAVSDAILKELRPDGIISSDPEVLRHLDHAAAEGGTSLIAPFGITKSKNELGSAYKNSVISPDDFYAIEDFADKKAEVLSKEILSGASALNPYKKGTDTPCTYCRFANICRIGMVAEEGSYRYITDKAEEILDKISDGED